MWHTIHRGVIKMAGGRPRKVIDQTTFESLCEMQCTKDEICSILKCDEKTLTKWCIENYKLSFSDTFKKVSAVGKMSLRRAQYKAAIEGNTTMMVWLGKQWLGQREPKDDGDAPEDAIEKDMDAYEE